MQNKIFRNRNNIGKLAQKKFYMNNMNQIFKKQKVLLKDT